MKKTFLAAAAAFLMAVPAMAQQSQCGPEASVREAMTVIPERMELNEAQRKDFSDQVNAAPPPTNYPVPDTLILGRAGEQSFVIHRHFQDPTQLCIIYGIPQRSFFGTLVEQFMGVRS